MSYGVIPQQKATCENSIRIGEMTDPAMISAAVTELLSGTDHEDSFVVHRLAKDLAVGIADERARKDGDMYYAISFSSQRRR